MPNLSQLKRERMLAFLQKIKEKYRDDDDMLIALGEIESELTSKKYGLVWEQHEEAVDVMMRDNIPVFTEAPEREITAAPGQGYNFILKVTTSTLLHLPRKSRHQKPPHFRSPVRSYTELGSCSPERLPAAQNYSNGHTRQEASEHP